jgi:carbonic anhydrase/acetyltransferase-like protein (isoleucine patch superfamily)
MNIISVAFSPLTSFREISLLSIDFSLKSSAFFPKSHIGVFVKAIIYYKIINNTLQQIYDLRVIIGRVELKKNSNIWFNATLRGDLEPIIIGEGSNIQDGSVIHTDPGCPTIVGKGVTVGHMVMLHGCEISDDCIIGIGSTILNKAKIGKNCIIGANSLVTENKVIPDRSLVLGSPGKVVRQVTDEEIEHIKENARDYVENIKKYKK